MVAQVHAPVVKKVVHAAPVAVHHEPIVEKVIEQVAPVYHVNQVVFGGVGEEYVRTLDIRQEVARQLAQRLEIKATLDGTITGQLQGAIQPQVYAPQQAYVPQAQYYHPQQQVYQAQVNPHCPDCVTPQAQVPYPQAPVNPPANPTPQQPVPQQPQGELESFPQAPQSPTSSPQAALAPGSPLARFCAACHDSGRQEPSGGFDLASPLTVENLEAATEAVTSGRMPKKNRLTQEEKVALLAQIASLSPPVQ